MRLRYTIRGIEAVQVANQRVIAALKPQSAFGRAIRWATQYLHRYAISVTHVITGALRGSHRMEITNRGMRGRIFLARETRNPVTYEAPYRYGLVEHGRGGSHAFYQRTFFEAGPEAAEGALRLLRRGLGGASVAGSIRSLIRGSM